MIMFDYDYKKILFDPKKVTYNATDKVAIIDGDSSDHFPNLSLQKISAWEKRNGVQHVRLVKLKHQRNAGVLGIHTDCHNVIEELKKYDRVYASFIFTRSKPVAKELINLLFDSIIVGGTGADEYYDMVEGDLRAKPKIISQLPLEIENIYPDHELYESDWVDANLAFWNNHENYKYAKKYKKYVVNYGITPKDGSWGGNGMNLSVDENVVHKFDEAAANNGFKDGKTWRGITKGNGYSSKGCPRKCTFCVVPIIQGDIAPTHYGLLGVINWILPIGFHPTMDEIIKLYKAQRLKIRPHVFFDKHHAVKRISPFLTISDNNFPADPTCIEKMDYMIANDIAVNLNQGMDARLLTAKERIDKTGVRFPGGDEICEKLSKLHFMNFKGTARQMHFAWDFIGVGRIVVDGITKLVEQYGMKYGQFMVYCLSGFNTNFEQDYQRVITLRKLGVDPYIMLFRNVDGSEGTKYDGALQDWRLKHLTRWTNNKIIFKSTSFEQYENYLKELQKRTNGEHSEEHDIMLQLECFDWLTSNYINHV